MRAGGERPYYSVSPFEKVDSEGWVEEDEESDEEDLRMEVGEACEKVRVE